MTARDKLSGRVHESNSIMYDGKYRCAQTHGLTHSGLHVCMMLYCVNEDRSAARNCPKSDHVGQKQPAACLCLLQANPCPFQD